MGGLVEGDAVYFAHIKRHCDESQCTIDPAAVLPVGPQLGLTAPHGRVGE